MSCIGGSTAVAGIIQTTHRIIAGYDIGHILVERGRLDGYSGRKELTWVCSDGLERCELLLPSADSTFSTAALALRSI